MEPMLETIELDMEESHDLMFKVKVEGAEPSPAKVRLVCESGDVAYMFNGKPTAQEGVVQFTLPVMKGKLQEGDYASRVEVLIENRYFAPVLFNINFKKAMKVVAEAITVQTKKVAPEVRVSAVPVVVQKPVAPVAKPIVVEAPPAPKPAPAPPVKPVERRAPPPARINASTTLKERYQRKLEGLDAEDQEAIRELARDFVKGKK